MIIRMLKAKENDDKEFVIWGSGKPTREWIYVKDLARMLVESIESQGLQIDPVNIAQNHAYAIRETAEIIISEQGKSSQFFKSMPYKSLSFFLSTKGS